MIESSDRVEQFKAEIADMRLRDPATGKDAQFLKLGIFLLVAGPIVTVLSYFGSHSNSGAAQQDYIVVALIGVSLTIVGAALFLRYSLAQFLRFWLARLIFEQKAQTDRIVGTATTETLTATKN